MHLELNEQVLRRAGGGGGGRRRQRAREAAPAGRGGGAGAAFGGDAERALPRDADARRVEPARARAALEGEAGRARRALADAEEQNDLPPRQKGVTPFWVWFRVRVSALERVLWSEANRSNAVILHAPAATFVGARKLPGCGDHS